MAKAITQEKVAERVRECIGDHILCTGEDHGETIITIKIESIDKLREISTALRDDEILGFDYLSFVTAIDYMTYPEPPVHRCRFEAVYQLFSVEGGHHLRFKVPVPERDGKYYLYSVTPIWRSAEFSENEAWDMFGIDFLGHPDMRRLYMPEDWEGHPLRKDYGLREGQDYGVIKAQELKEKYDKIGVEGLKKGPI